MTPPRAPDNGTGNMPPAVSFCLVTLKTRSDFLACARARQRAAMPGFILQGRDRRDGVATTRIGYTASKKVGNAVARNRAKRRLRALARAGLPLHGRPGWDYVLIARRQVTAERDFSLMGADLAQALTRLHIAEGS